ncbi:MAG TPA: class I SAM-dependent methyltransferase [Casimicrobiaceae bacterium]|nr:class I SAM-dependent methyltransferase [Casimicrobiaceae bacterium]
MKPYEGTDNLEVMAEARNYNAFLLDLVLAHRGDAQTAVDFGAGIGTFARMVRDRGVNVLCIEPDAAQCALLRRLGLPAEDDLDALQDATLRYVYSLNVLEHIEDDARALRQIAQKLAPGGRLLVYVPAFDVLFSSMDRKVGHHRRYRRTQLVSLVQQAGLEVIAARYVDFFGFLATLAYKALGSGKGDIDRRSVIVFDRFLFPLSRCCDRVLGGFVGKNVYIVARK